MDFYCSFSNIRASCETVTVYVMDEMCSCVEDVGEDLLKMCQRNVVLNSHLLEPGGKKLLTFFHFPTCSAQVHKGTLVSISTLGWYSLPKVYLFRHCPTLRQAFWVKPTELCLQDC